MSAPLFRRLLLACALLPAACRRPPPPSTTTLAVVSLPRADSPVTINGELDEPAWPKAWHSPPLADAAGHEAPFADVSAMADDRFLYLSLYAADEDLRSRGDRLTVTVGPLTLVLAPGGHDVVPPGVQVKEDVDGVVDDPAGDDEEWVNEVAIPRALLGADEVPFRVVRVDAGRSGRTEVLAWPRGGPAVFRLPKSGKT